MEYRTSMHPYIISIGLKLVYIASEDVLNKFSSDEFVKLIQESKSFSIYDCPQKHIWGFKSQLDNITPKAKSLSILANIGRSILTAYHIGDDKNTAEIYKI